MVYSLTYRRPPHVSSARASFNGDEKVKSIGESTIDSQTSQGVSGIPEALSFDRIISGGTCPVSISPLLQDMTTRRNSESHLLTWESPAMHYP